MSFVSALRPMLSTYSAALPTVAQLKVTALPDSVEPGGGAVIAGRPLAPASRLPVQFLRYELSKSPKSPVATSRRPPKYGAKPRKSYQGQLLETRRYSGFVTLRDCPGLRMKSGV